MISALNIRNFCGKNDEFCGKNEGFCVSGALPGDESEGKVSLYIETKPFWWSKIKVHVR